MKRYITCEITCFLKSVCLGDNYVTYNTARQTVDDRGQYCAKKIRFTCLLIKSRIYIYVSLFKSFIAQNLCTVCTRTSYKIVPLTSMNKYLHYGTSKTEMNISANMGSEKS